MAFYPYDQEVYDGATKERWEIHRHADDSEATRFHYDDEGNLVRPQTLEEYVAGITGDVVVIPVKEDGVEQVSGAYALDPALTTALYDPHQSLL